MSTMVQTLSSIELSTAKNDYVNVSFASSTESTLSLAYSNYDLTIYESLMVAMGSVGMIANGFVLFLLLYHGQVRRSTTNKFICNQTVMDTIASLAMLLTTLPDNIETIAPGESPLSWFICLVLSSNAALDAPVYASQAGLLVITVERNRFRPWMVRAGVVLPWLSGIVAYVIPTWATTRMINGECWTYVWPTRDMFKAYVVFAFLYVFALPVGVFVFCYGRIISVIRRQGHQVAVNAVVPALNGATTEPAAEQGNKKSERSVQRKGETSLVSQSQKKVVRTMLIVTAMYTVCWFPLQFYIVSIVLKWMPINFNILLMLTVLGGVNIACNPIVYASHFDVIRRTVLAVPRKVNEILRLHQCTTISCFYCGGTVNASASSTDYEKDEEGDSSNRTRATVAAITTTTTTNGNAKLRSSHHFHVDVAETSPHRSDAKPLDATARILQLVA